MALLARGQRLLAAAARTEALAETLGQHRLDGRGQLETLDAHLDDSVEHPGRTVGVHGGEDQVSGHRGAKGDLGGLVVSDLADQDHVRILPEDRAKADSERHSGGGVDRGLAELRKVELDRVFEGDDVGPVAAGLRDLLEGSVHRRRLAAPGRPGDDQQALVGVEQAAKALLGLGVHSEPVDAVGAVIGRREAKHDLLAVIGRKHGHADAMPSLVQIDLTVLRGGGLVDRQGRHHLDATRGLPIRLDRHLTELVEDSVDAHGDRRGSRARREVDVARSQREPDREQVVEELDHVDLPLGPVPLQPGAECRDPADGGAGLDLDRRHRRLGPLDRLPTAACAYHCPHDERAGDEKQGDGDEQ